MGDQAWLRMPCWVSKSWTSRCLEVGVDLELVDRRYDVRGAEQALEVVDLEVADADGAVLAVGEQLLQRPVCGDGPVEVAGQRLTSPVQGPHLTSSRVSACETSQPASVGSRGMRHRTFDCGWIRMFDRTLLGVSRVVGRGLPWCLLAGPVHPVVPGPNLRNDPRGSVPRNRFVSVRPSLTCSSS